MRTELFSSGELGTLRLKNRIVMSAMHLGLPLEREAAFLAERARGGAALVTAVMGVTAGGTPADMPVLCEENRAGVRAMAERIHAAGGLLSVQLFHAGRNCEEGELADPDAYPAAPSPVPSPIYRTVPRELTESGMMNIMERFGQAAGLCRACGADAVEVSCSAGYLLSEFLSSLTNRRTDRFGGAFSNRAEFPLMVLRRVRGAVGAGYPVILRISGADMLGGYGLSDMQDFVGLAEPWIDAVSVTGGWHESPIPQISMDVPEGGFGFLAKAIRLATALPVVACNRVTGRETAQRLLDEGCGDFVGCARAFLADGAFAEKIRLGRPYMRCVGCNKGCIERILRHQPATCIFNPTAGEEDNFPPPAERSQRVLVIGGGPAGLFSAQYLARRGHAVTVCTREAQWGGRLRFAALAPHKEAIAHNIDAMVDNAGRAGVRLLAGTEIDRGALEGGGYDAYWLAEGCRERLPEPEGARTRRIYRAEEIFQAEPRFLAELARRRVAIIGGGSVAAELAYLICDRAAPGCESREFLSLFADPALRESLRPRGRITLIARGSKIARGLGATRWILMRQLSRFPIEMMTESTVMRATETGLEICRGGETVFLEADTVILAAGYAPADSGLAEYLRALKKPVVLVGDCAGQGSGILNATQSALAAVKLYGGDAREQDGE